MTSNVSVKHNDHNGAYIVRDSRPQTRVKLYSYLKTYLDISIPRRRICKGHASPFDYLWYVFNSDFKKENRPVNTDAVVWANRGGGKTFISAVATLLDCIFKPGFDIRILGGSLEQSIRMYKHLVNFASNEYNDLIDGKILTQGFSFLNGSQVSILSQSEKSVRGVHVNKIRCDEVELFEPEVLSAAGYTTESRNGYLPGMEYISTMHRPYGLMQKIVEDAGENNIPVFKWCLWETIEKCRDRSCSRCRLNSYCMGRAKKAAGYMKIDDVITQLNRSSRTTFESEMLCLRPSRENVVFPDFNPDVHVKSLTYDPLLPLYRSIDFGYVNPFVCLWIQVDRSRRVCVIDEYVQTKLTVAQNIRNTIEKTPCPPHQVAATYCDPAGKARNDVTGTSPVDIMMNMNIPVLFHQSNILDGIEKIRSAVQSGDGRVRLVIDPKCSHLIAAMQCYHYPDPGPNGKKTEHPLKDGTYDHPIDALRYFMIHYDISTGLTERSY